MKDKFVLICSKLYEIIDDEPKSILPKNVVLYVLNPFFIAKIQIKQ